VKCSLFLFSIILLFLFALPNLSFSTTAKVSSLKAAIGLALSNNPELNALRSRYEAMKNVPSQKGSLPDPVIGFNALNLPVDTFDIDQEAMTQMQIRLSQKLPFPGKLSLRKDAALRDAEALWERVREMELSISRQVEERWWDVFYTEKALWIIERNKGNLQDMVDVAKSKYEVGKGLQQDVLLAQLELTNLFNQEAQLKGLLSSLLSELRRLVGEAKQIEVPFSNGPFLEPPPAVDPVVKTACESRPLILSYKKEMEAMEKRLALSKKDFMPDFSLGAAYGFRQDGPNGMKRPDFVSFSISMNIPIWAHSKQSRKVAENSLRLVEKRQLLTGAFNEVKKEVESAISIYRASYRQAQLYKQAVIPQAKQTLASMMSAYQVNRVDFLNVIRARLALIGYERQYWKAVSEAMKARARLIAAVGGQDVWDRIRGKEEGHEKR